jgi:ribosomal protein S18 acetylase RimI-like enzyme
VHGFRDLNRSKPLLYSSILPGLIEAVPYSLTITCLPVIALFWPSLALGIFIADFVLSAPFLFVHERGFWHAVNHLPDIYAYKYFGSVVCLYAGLKTTMEKLLGRTGKWKNNWENSGRADMTPKPLTRRYMRRHLDAFLQLEREWVDLGEKPWSRENFLLGNPQKWRLSSYVALQGKPVGYAIVSEKEPGQAYLHKVLVDRKCQGLGIGGRLLEDARGKCQQRGIRTVRFKVRLDNQSANRLYRKNGVVYTGQEVSADGVERYLCEWKVGS